MNNFALRGGKHISQLFTVMLCGLLLLFLLLSEAEMHKFTFISFRDVQELSLEAPLNTDLWSFTSLSPPVKAEMHKLTFISFRSSHIQFEV